jgi:hypothetical protein
MTAAVHATMDLDLAFPTAGVGFSIEIRPGSDTEGSTLLLRLRALTAGKTARFHPESSYALGDFVGGLCRWLGTKGVSVTHSEQEISGRFHVRYTLPQTLQTTQELCQMLEDKFAAYPHTILT